MLRIILVIDDSTRVYPGVISKISRLSGNDLLEIRRAIACHAPVLDKPIFGRSDADAARDILALLNELEDSNIPYRAYELIGQDVYDEEKKYFEINFTKLSNMIDSREKSLGQQRVIGWLEDPE